VASEWIPKKSLTSQVRMSARIQFALMIVGHMDIVKPQTANVTWDGKVQCAVNQSAQTNVVDMASVLFGVELTVQASASAQMAGQVMIAASLHSPRPCVSVQRIV